MNTTQAVAETILQGPLHSKKLVYVLSLSDIAAWCSMEALSDSPSQKRVIF